MPNTIRHKRSAANQSIPTVGDLELGELAINTFMGKVFIKRDQNGVETIIRIGAETTFSYQEAQPSDPIHGDTWLHPISRDYAVYVEGLGWETIS